MGRDRNLFRISGVSLDALEVLHCTRHAAPALRFWLKACRIHVTESGNTFRFAAVTIRRTRKTHGIPVNTSANSVAESEQGQSVSF